MYFGVVSIDFFYKNCDFNIVAVFPVLLLHAQMRWGGGGGGGRCIVCAFNKTLIPRLPLNAHIFAWVGSLVPHD